MKRTLIYIVLLIVTFIAPVDRVNVGHLQPVEVIAVSEMNNGILIQTDTGDMGIGENVAEAVKNLKENATGIIYMDTARYLLVDENTQNQTAQLRSYLKDSVQVCLTDGEIDMEEVGKYLKTHGKYPTLREWKPNSDAPILVNEK